MNPLELAVQSALKANAYQLDLFAKAGTINHPRGVIMTAYRNARRSMRQALMDRNKIWAANEVMTALIRTIRFEIAPLLEKAQLYGLRDAQKQLEFYGVKPTDDFMALGLQAQREAALDAVVGTVEQQWKTTKGILQVGSDVDLILGDEERIGVLRPGDPIASVSTWISSLMWTTWGGVVQTSTKQKNRIEKLAVVAVDSRTTDCCLNVHGQHVPFDEPFHLTGTPRYADHLDWSPFHNYCRTSIALYYEDYDDGITDQMKKEAGSEKDRRGEDKRRKLAGLSPLDRSSPKKIRSYRVAKPGGADIETPTPTALSKAWCNGSWYRTPTHMKWAVKEEFGLKTWVWDPKNTAIDQNLVKALQPTIRQMYNQTQEFFRSQGVTSVRLYRGLKNPTDMFSVLESWTSDYSTAARFDGFTVLVEDIPIHRIFMAHVGPNWVNGKFGNQFEYIVLPPEFEG
ncbi:hypothetical protein ADN00_15740 [Ornatilinea apprima]|uniref:Uncharacterized protein n=1 Tax=Ornatilinea apprima TaxID=1134406 RepID=A0A0P6XKW6_9CHLR|nr:hypothetical protein [Ornatilinea apprima]KPL72267.1 hypothetical protein ADN00_15740 [Ornatilinea apprima]